MLFPLAGSSQGLSRALTNINSKERKSIPKCFHPLHTYALCKNEWKRQKICRRGKYLYNEELVLDTNTCPSWPAQSHAGGVNSCTKPDGEFMAFFKLILAVLTLPKRANFWRGEYVYNEQVLIKHAQCTHIRPYCTTLQEGRICVRWEDLP